MLKQLQNIQLNILRLFVCSVVALASVGCSSVSKQTAEQSAEVAEQKIPIKFYPIFGDKPEIIDGQAIFNLTPQQEAEFLAFYNSPEQEDDYGHRRIVKYVRKFIGGFNFHSDTLVAQQAMEERRGNCLTLGILTTALARVADVDVGYELMQAPPVYQRKGRVILSSQHVRSILYRPLTAETANTIFMFQGVIKLDYFPARGSRSKRRVNENEFISMYYRNLSGIALAEERVNDAFWYIVESLKYDEDNAHSTNILALVYDRMGYYDDAEALYKHGLNKAQEKLEILSNYHKFLLRRDRFAEAAEIKEQIIKIDQQNPFDWLELADEELLLGEKGQAKLYYKKVIELAPYLHEGYFGLAKAEYLDGNFNRARKLMKKALDRVYEKETKSLYQAKLFALTNKLVDN